jgi:hypothetical protein
MVLFTTALGLYGGVLWSGEFQGPILYMSWCLLPTTNQMANGMTPPKKQEASRGDDARSGSGSRSWQKQQTRPQPRSAPAPAPSPPQPAARSPQPAARSPQSADAHAPRPWPWRHPGGIATIHCLLVRVQVLHCRCLVTSSARTPVALSALLRLAAACSPSQVPTPSKTQTVGGQTEGQEAPRAKTSNRVHQ